MAEESGVWLLRSCRTLSLSLYGVKGACESLRDSFFVYLRFGLFVVSVFFIGPLPGGSSHLLNG